MACFTAKNIGDISEQRMGCIGASAMRRVIEGPWCNTAIAYYTLCRFVFC